MGNGGGGIKGQVLCRMPEASEVFPVFLSAFRGRHHRGIKGQVLYRPYRPSSRGATRQRLPL